MSNWVDLRLDILASSPAGINDIERALQNPCEELVECRARLTGEEPKDSAASVKDIVSLKPVGNIGFIDTSVNKARRFENEWKDRFWGLVWSHIHFVSAASPRSVFLAQYWDDCMSYGGKVVIHGGDEICSSYDGDHHAQRIEWVLPNIFAPFRAEYELGLGCGSLWREWIEGMRRELAILGRRYSSPTGLQSVQCLEGKQSEDTGEIVK